MLTEEGKPVSELTLILEGHADVLKSGKTVAKVKGGQVIGELSLNAKGLATADVKPSEKMRVFSIPSAELKKIIAKNPDIGASFATGMRDQIARKLA